MEEHSNTVQFERGCVVNNGLRERLSEHPQDASVEGNLLTTYLDYHVKRRLLQYLLTGENGVDAFGNMIGSVIRLAFKVLLSQSRDEIEDATRIGCEVGVRPDYSISPESPRLGGLGLGRGNALGYATADAGPLVFVEIRLSEKQLVRLHDHPWALSAVMRVLDAVVPIQNNYRVQFRLRTPGDAFRLVGASDAEDGKCVLGFTTALKG
jgi:hypothetical protein